MISEPVTAKSEHPNRRLRRSITSVATAATLCGCAIIGAASAPADAPPAVCHLFEPTAEYVEHVITMQLEKVEHRLRIPKVYFEDPWDWVDGERHTSQLIRVTGDDFVPVYRPMTATLNKMGRRDGYFRFLIGDHVEFDDLLEIKFRYAAPSVDSAATDACKIESDFGLTALLPADGAIHRDLYIGQTDRAESPSILVCDKPEHYPFPQCTHNVRLHGMDVIVSYDRQLLPDWRDLEAKVADFIGCAVENLLVQER